ncbi:MAG TPA: hypothetical protein VGH80_08735 [Xanthomonadaceae bacterium]
MTENPRPVAFDDQAAWLRRFQSDAQGNLKALALRLREAMPERVTLLETSSGFFSRTTTITGVTVDMDQHRYTLEVVKGRLKATVAMVVRDIVLNTKSVDPAEWFVKLAEETKTASDHAKRLAQSLSAFMGS